MLRTSTNFDTYNQAANKKPVWVIEIDGIATKFASGTFGDIDANYKKLLKKMVVNNGQLDRLKHHITFPNINFTILEQDETLLDLMNANAFIGKKITAKIGFQELNIADFADLVPCYIKEVRFIDDYQYLEINAQHRLAGLKHPIFGGMATATLGADLTYAGTTVTVDATASFTAAGSATWNETGITFISIDDELMEYTAKPSGTTFTVTRGSYGKQQKHNQGATVYETVYFHHYAKTLMRLLTTTSAGTNGSYDLGIADYGLGIDVSEVDTNQILNEVGPYGKLEGATNRGGYVNPDETIENGLDWIEKNILNVMHGYFIITPENKLGVKLGDMVGDNYPDYALTADDINELPVYEQQFDKNITHARIMNVIYGTGQEVYKYEYQAASYSVYGKSRNMMMIKLPNLFTFFPWDDIDDTGCLLERFFGMYGDPMALITLQTKLEHQVLRPGDQLKLTHAKIPDIQAGSLGITNKGMEVTESIITYQDGKISPKVVCEWPNSVDNGSMALTMAIWNEADIDDTTLTRDADKAEDNLQAADAYLDIGNSPLYYIGWLVVEFTITPPGDDEAGSDGRYITIYLQGQQLTDTNDWEIERRVYYDERSSDEFTAEVGYYMKGSNYVAELRAHWTATSGGTDPTVKMTKVKMLRFNSSITETGL